MCTMILKQCGRKHKFYKASKVKGYNDIEEVEQITTNSGNLQPFMSRVH